MDSKKSSNRTDLLAAGKKRLQQFRQKKENGGKEGKSKGSKESKGKATNASSSSTGMGDKSDFHDDEANVAADAAIATEELPQFAEEQEEAELHCDSSSSVPASMENSIYDSEGQHREAQVSDVGAIQEAHNLGPKQHDAVRDVSQSNASSESRTDVASEATVFLQGALDASMTYDSVPVIDSQVSTGATYSESGDLEMNEAVTSSQVIPIAGDTHRKLYQGNRDVVSELSDDVTSCLLSEQYILDGSSAHVGNGQVSVLEVEAENSVAKNSISPGVCEICASFSQLPETWKRSSQDELMQEQLYLAIISKDFFLLQLLEQSEQQVDAEEYSKRNLNAELARFKSELQEVMSAKEDLHSLLQHANIEEKKSSSAVNELKIQLADCNSLLTASQAENERLLEALTKLTNDKNKLEVDKGRYIGENKRLLVMLTDYDNSLTSLRAETANLNAKIDFSTGQEQKLEEEKAYFVHENENLSRNLAECKHILASLQEENSRLNLSLATEMDTHKKLQGDREFLVRESEGLSLQIAGYQEKLSMEHNQRMKVEDNLKDAMRSLEELIDENIFLENSLVVYKTTLIDLDSRKSRVLCDAAEVGTCVSSHPSAAGGSNYHRNRVNQMDAPSGMFGEPVSDVLTERSHVDESIMNLHGNSRFVILERHLEEANIVMQELEKVVDEMHSYSASLRRSMAKGAAPAVSKLIEVFESKAHLDDCELGETCSPESDIPLDPYFSAKDQVSKLRGVFKALSHDAEYVSSLLSLEKDGGPVTIAELEAEKRIMKEYYNNLELWNIELEVLCAAFKEHAYCTEAEKIMLKTSYINLKRQVADQRTEKLELNKKLIDYCQRICELQDKFCEVRRSAGDFISELSNQMEHLQKQMVQYVLAAEGGWNNTLARVVHMAEKLDASVGKSLASPSFDNGNTSYLLDCISASVEAAAEEILGLKIRIVATSNERDAFSKLYEDMGKKYDALHAENEQATDLLQRISRGLISVLHDIPEHVREVESQKQQYSHHDLLDAGYCEALITEVSSLVGEIRRLKELNSNLHSELLERTNIIDELKQKSIDPHDVLTLVENVLGVQDIKTNLNEPPLLHLQSSVSLLVKKYREASEDVSLLRGGIKSKMLELEELQGLVDRLNSSNFQLENEILVFKESSIQAKKTFDALRDELQEKSIELEQSEQRVASLREKLSIAVAKGKGLVVQRDSLKQSLAETSSELERYAQELQLKDSRLFEVEEKLVAYSEAGERMEALESELSYIRNSATALRESFLLKDATLQGIEEILEDLDLPEHFHSKGIIEKVDWIAKSVSGYAVPPVDSDQRSSVGGGSQPDAGLMMAEAWKEEGQLNASPVDDSRRKYDELQTKLYELAKQNEMLEQSLVERNNLVQRWEEVLDRINTPPQLRSMEPEERIEWLVNALSQADDHLTSLQQKIDHLENYSVLLSADLEEARGRVSSLESNLLEVTGGKEEIYCRLEVLSSDHGKALEHVDLLENEADQLQREVDALQNKVVEKLKYEDRIRHVEGEICRLQKMTVDALPDSVSETFLVDGNSIECLEQSLRKLIEEYRRGSVEDFQSETTLADHGANLEVVCDREAGGEQILEHTHPNLDKPRIIDTVIEKEEVVEMSRELNSIRGELVHLKDERDEFRDKCQSLKADMEALAREKVDLQELVDQGEQKLASIREKLNVAVRKGKSLVQQRDSLKQSFEDMNAEISQMQSDLNLREKTILEHEKKISEMSTTLDQHKALEAESLFLKNQLTEVKRVVEERELTLSMICNKIDEISAADLLDVSDSVLKLDGIKMMCSDLNAMVVSSQQEAIKSKRAAELLLEELNKVQERNDGLQEELGRVYDEMSILLNEKESAASAKAELHSQVDKLTEERKKQIAQFEELKYSFHEVEKWFVEINALTADAFVKDVDLLNNLRATVGSNQRQIGSELPHVGVSGQTINKYLGKKGFLSATSFWESTTPDLSSDAIAMDIVHDLQQLKSGIVNLKERISKHSILMQQEAELLINDVSNLHRETVSQRKSLESMMHEFAYLESTGKGKDLEITVLRRCISLLYEAFAGSIMEIESGKAQMLGNILAAGDDGGTLKSLPLIDGGVSFISETPSEESIKDLADRLLFAVKDFISVQADSVGGHYKEFKTTISNLQQGLQEKDAQNERIHSDLVRQIKEAVAEAARYAQDFELAKHQVHDSVKRVKLMEEERSLLEQKLVDMQQKHTITIDLQGKVESLTDMLASKEQEIDSLMQALDEEENQMESLRSKIQELEELINKKNRDLLLVESARAKAMKKLSVTVAKFDELHHMSEGLLSEIENLQLQLQERDSEISFLRKEVTRSTNDVLLASKLSKEKSSDELNELLTWLDTMCSRVLIRDAQMGDINSQGNGFKERLQKDITTAISELEDLRVVAQSKEALLRAERVRVEELLMRKEALEASLCQKESELSVRAAGDSGNVVSEIVEVEPVIKKWAVPVTSVASQVRSLRKVNNDHVSLSIDADAGGTGTLQDEDDDKVHGFRSLTTSRFVPKFTRPVSDMVDGLWVSCDRALMRQPAFRLGIIIYWAVLHGLLASFVV